MTIDCSNRITTKVREQFDSQRRKNLLEAFKEYEYNETDKLSKIDLFSMLDEKAGQEFDRTIAAEMFEKMDVDNDELVTFKEFADVYIEVEEKLNHELAAFRDREIELGNQLNTWTKKLNDSTKLEKKNSFGKP